MKLYIQDKTRKLGCLKLAFYLFLAFFFGVCIIICFLHTVDLSHHFIIRHFPERYTEPLESETVTDLCNTLKLEMEDIRCSDNEIYSFDFFPDFINLYKIWTPREEVDNEIGKYLTNCSSWIETFADGVFQECSYDFKGDGVYTLDIDFTKGYSESMDSGGSVWRVCSYAIRNLSFRKIYICNPPD